MSESEYVALRHWISSVGDTEVTRTVAAMLDKYAALEATGHDVALAGSNLVCSLCLFVGDSEDPYPITIINGNLTCEPHNGYFQGGDHVQAIIAWKREHPEAMDG